MNNERGPDLPIELKSFEAQLAQLSPAAGAVNRDTLMYRAGWEACQAAHQCSGNGGHAGPSQGADRGRTTRFWLWPLSSAALLLLSATLGVLLGLRQPGERIVYVNQPVTAKSDAHAGGLSHATSPATVAVDRSGLPRTFIEPPARTLVSARGDYLSLRDRVLANGIDAIRPAAAAAPDDSLGISVRDSRYGVLVNEFRGG
jgi:hypothetical protein